MGSQPLDVYKLTSRRIRKIVSAQVQSQDLGVVVVLFRMASRRTTLRRRGWIAGEPCGEDESEKSPAYFALDFADGIF